MRALFSAAGEKAPANRFFVSGLRIKLSRGLLQPQILHGFLVWIAESKSVARELSGHIKFTRQFQAKSMDSGPWDGNARRRELEVSTARSASLFLSRQTSSVCVVALSVTHLQLFRCASPAPAAGTDRAHCGDWLLAQEEGRAEEEVQDAVEALEA